MADRSIGPSSYDAPASSTFRVNSEIKWGQTTATLPSDNFVIAFSLGQVTSVDLANGFNEIAVPDNAAVVEFQFPSTNTKTITLKGVTGDTGFGILPTGIIALTPATGTSRTIGITTNGAIAGVRVKYL